MKEIGVYTLRIRVYLNLGLAHENNAIIIRQRVSNRNGYCVFNIVRIIINYDYKFK